MKKLFKVIGGIVFTCIALYLFLELLLNILIPAPPPFGYAVPQIIALTIHSPGRQPPPPGGFTPTPTPTWPATEVREGTGNSLEAFTVRLDGAAIFISSSRGDAGVFRVTLKDRDGQEIQIVADCNGACKKEALIPLVAGEYTLEVTATGQWYIVMGLP